MSLLLDRNCLSYWYPLLQAAGLPQPKTIIVERHESLLETLDGNAPKNWDAFIGDLRQAVELLGTGYPVFLRTGQGSGKHEYIRTCFIGKAEDFPNHVAALVEWSEIVDLLGLPTRIWAVREFLRLDSPFRAFCGMPVVRERRYFVRDGTVICRHNYWSPDTIVSWSGSLPDGWQAQLARLNEPLPGEEDFLNKLAGLAGSALGGSWSIDFTYDCDGKWWITDCALAGHSYHWPDCPNKDLFPREEQ